MLTCKICGRKFKTQAALGGHTSSAHPKPASNPTEAQGSQPTEPAALLQQAVAQEPQPMEEKDEAASPGGRLEPQLAEDGESIAEEIRGYLKRGYSFRQLTKQLGFNPRTVRQEMEKFILPEGDELGKVGDGLPVIRKIGGGAEIITPEAVLRSYMDGDDSDALELRGIMKFRAAMLMVMDLMNIRKADAEAYALMVKPILDMMKEARAEQDAAAERARASVTEAAVQAAEETATRVAVYFDKKKPDIASTPSPFEGLMARTLETAMTTLLNKLFPGAGGEATPGFTVRERQKGD